MIQRDDIFVALANLAADADDQVRHLENIGLPGFSAQPGPDLRNIDELALEFEDAISTRESLLESGELTKQQVERLLELDSDLEAMSGQENATLWTVDALRTRPEWEVIRDKARRCLSLF